MMLLLLCLEHLLRCCCNRYTKIPSSTISVPLGRQYNAYRLNDKLQVGQYAALLDIQQIKTDPLIEADVIAVPAGLPEASDARFYQKALSLIGGVLAHLTRKGGTWTDDRHVALQNIDELWQLVDAGLADEMTHARNSWVIFYLEYRAILLIQILKIFEAFFRIYIHGAELVHLECLAVLADTLLLEEDRSFAVTLDGNGNDSIEPGQKDQHEKAEHDIEQTLGKTVAITRGKTLGCLHGLQIQNHMLLALGCSILIERCRVLCRSRRHSWASCCHVLCTHVDEHPPPGTFSGLQLFSHVYTAGLCKNQSAGRHILPTRYQLLRMLTVGSIRRIQHLFNLQVAFRISI